MSEVTATVGRHRRMEISAAVRGSLDLADTAMPTQMDQAARSGVNTSWARRSGPWMSAEATAGWAKSSTTATKRPKTAYATATEGTNADSALPSSSSSRRMGRCEHWLESALQSLPHHRVSGEDGRDEYRYSQHVEQRMFVPQRHRC
jgi:hypothetical protein